MLPQPMANNAASEHMHLASDYHTGVDNRGVVNKSAKGGVSNTTMAMREQLRQEIHKRFKSLKDAFRAMDRDGSLSIDKDELKKMILRHSAALEGQQFEAALNELLAVIDRDRSGAISVGELHRALEADAATVDAWFREAREFEGYKEGYRGKAKRTERMRPVWNRERWLERYAANRIEHYDTLRRDTGYIGGTPRAASPRAASPRAALNPLATCRAASPRSAFYTPGLPVSPRVPPASKGLYHLPPLAPYVHYG